MLETPHTQPKNESVEREIQNRRPLTQEIIGKFLELVNESGNIVEYIDVVTKYGDPRRITRHPTDKFLLKIAGPNFTSDLDPANPYIYRELFILNSTLAEINEPS